MKYKLDKYEKEIERSFARREFKRVKNYKKVRRQLQEAAHRTMIRVKKGKRVNIRMSNDDFLGIWKRAQEEGIPYQTLMASIIHKYVAGYLVDKRKWNPPGKPGVP